MKYLRQFIPSVNIFINFYECKTVSKLSISDKIDLKLLFYCFSQFSPIRINNFKLNIDNIKYE